MRKGNTLIGHCSTNGTDWSYVWFSTIDMSNRIEVGIAVTAHQFGSNATSSVENVVAGNLTPLGGIWPLPEPQILLGGETWGSAEFQRVGGFKMLVGGAVGDAFTIRSSPVVETPPGLWPILGTVTNQLGVVEFIDPQASSNLTRFYRAERVGP